MKKRRKERKSQSFCSFLKRTFSTDDAPKTEKLLFSLLEANFYLLSTLRIVLKLIEDSVENPFLVSALVTFVATFCPTGSIHFWRLAMRRREEWEDVRNETILITTTTISTTSSFAETMPPTRLRRKKVWKLKNRNLEESKNLWKSWEIKKPQDFVKKQTPKTHH